MKLKPMTASLYEKIQKKIKNRQDISDLIDGVDIRNVDLSRAIIKNFNRPNGDISNVNLSYAIIGEEGKQINFAGCKMRHVNFHGAKFLGKLILRGADLRFSDLSEAFIPYVVYQRADLRGCKFCGIVFKLGSLEGLKAKFDSQFFVDLARAWDIDLVKIMEVFENKEEDKND